MFNVDKSQSTVMRILRRPLVRYHGLLLGSDIYERAAEQGCRRRLTAKRRQRLETIRAAKLLFIHVPKNAGMSVNEALYGQQLKHASWRYYAHFAPALVTTLPSVAIVRDPVERFLSAFDYAIAGRTGDNQVAPEFNAQYRRWQTVDAALDHLERAASPYAIDHIFRPQAWYIEAHDGSTGPDHLVPFEQLHRMADILHQAGADPVYRSVPHRNRSQSWRHCLSSTQISRLRYLYAADFELHRRVVAASEGVE